MVWLKRILTVIVIAVASLAVIGLFLPKTYHVERTVEIAAPAVAVHAYVGDLEGWEAWTPWLEADPTMVVTRGATSTGVGASQTWVGDSGAGELTFTRCDPAQGIAYDLSFEEGKYRSTGALVYEDIPSGTRVTWSMDGDNDGLVARWFGIMMDTMVGPMFDDGLAKLKTVVEGGVEAVEAS